MKISSLDWKTRQSKCFCVVFLAHILPCSWQKKKKIHFRQNCYSFLCFKPGSLSHKVKSLSPALCLSAGTWRRWGAGPWLTDEGPCLLWLRGVINFSKRPPRLSAFINEHLRAMDNLTTPLSSPWQRWVERCGREGEGWGGGVCCSLTDGRFNQ